jgi:CheY-like chemotaxis protein
MERFKQRRILVVEDEYLIAAELADLLQQSGAEVVGPVGSVPQALALIAERKTEIDGATLDVNLRGTPVFPVADALRTLGIPFVFCTGYDTEKIPSAYRSEPCCTKPIDSALLMKHLAAQLQKLDGNT